MKNYILGIALGSLIYTSSACSNTNTKTPQSATTVQNTENSQTITPKFADSKINEVYQHYIHLKTALTNDDNAEATMGAKMLAKALENSGIKNTCISNMINATDIKAKRQNLDCLSNQLALIFKKSKLQSGVIYKQFCPMANDGKGGYWLASEKKINNPYYGKQMSTCGSVDEEIK